MTDKPRATGPGQPGPAPGGTVAGSPGSEPERVVIRDKRRIDPGGARITAANAADVPVAPDTPGAVDASAGSTGAKGADSSPGPAAPPGAADTAADTATDGSMTDGPATGGPATDVAGPDPGAAAAPGAAAVDEAVADGSTEAGGSQDAAAAETGAGATVEPPVEPPVEPLVEPLVEEPAAIEREVGTLRAQLEERTRDLQRLSAEYANYRKRVDRDRGLAAEQTTGAVLGALLPVLDDLDRARDHGDLVGPFAAVAEQLHATLAKFGLSAFGEKGDPFDPTRHEAVAHLTSPEVAEPTCIDVLRRGYLLGDRLLRPAMVAVADPE